MPKSFSGRIAADEMTDILTGVLKGGLDGTVIWILQQPGIRDNEFVCGRRQQWDFPEFGNQPVNRMKSNRDTGRTEKRCQIVDNLTPKLQYIVYYRVLRNTRLFYKNVTGR